MQDYLLANNQVWFLANCSKQFAHFSFGVFLYFIHWYFLQKMIIIIELFFSVWLYPYILFVSY